MTINDNQWQSMTTNDNQWQFNDIIANTKNTTGIKPCRNDPRSLIGCRSSRIMPGYCYYDWPLVPVPFGTFSSVSESFLHVHLTADLASCSPAPRPPVISRAAFRRCLIWLPLASLCLAASGCPGRTLSLPPPCGLSVASALPARASLLSLTWWNKDITNQ